jgi:hypothetical protein
MLHISPCQIWTKAKNLAYLTHSTEIKFKKIAYLASNTKANIPAASGAAADVPV